MRHIRLITATLAGSLFISGSAYADERLFTPSDLLVERVRLSAADRIGPEPGASNPSPRAPEVVFPITTRRPDFGAADAGYGTARGRMHHGQDVFAPAGTPLVAVRDGVVIEAGSDGGAGNHIAIYSREQDETYAYFHMSAPTALKPGQTVKAGRRVGSVGCTGSCWGDHLHFEVRKGRGLWEAASLDPMPLLRQALRAR